MRGNQLSVILDQLRQCRATAFTDGQLLERFARLRDEAAFASLVERHGPLVLAVCRRVLRDGHLAEDAFQATFMILAKRAGNLKWKASAGPWLHSVAFHLALRTRRQAERRRRREREAATSQFNDTGMSPEFMPILDEELHRLPDKYRAPVTLCYLSGKTVDETAIQLGWPRGTVASRLARAKDLLRQRLTRRGVSVGAGLLGLELSEATAAVPAALSAATVRAAVAFSAGGAAIPAAAIAEGALHIMLMKKLVWMTGAVVMLGALGTAGVVAYQDRQVSADPGEQRPIPILQAAADKATPRVDLYGNELPEGAVARLGSARFRHAGLSNFALLPDGKSILSVGRDRMLRTWDMSTGQQLRALQLEETGNLGWGILLSPEGKIAAGPVGNEFHFWETATGKLLKKFPAPKERYGCVCFAPDGKTVGATVMTPELVLWNWETGNQRSIPLNRRQIGLDSTFHCNFSPDGKWLLAGGGFGELVQVFEAATGREVHRLNCNASTSTVSPDGKLIAVSSFRNDEGKSESVIRIFDMGTGKETRQFPLGHENSYHSLTYSGDGRLLACCFSDQSCLLDSATGQVLQRLPGRPLGAYFTADGKNFVFSDGYRLHVWDIEKGRDRHDFPSSIGGEIAVAFSSDSRLLATGGWVERTVSLWDAGSGRLLHTMPVGGKERRYIRNVAFSDDGKTLLACQGIGEGVQFWDVASGKELRTIQLHDAKHPNPHLVGESPAYYYQFHLSGDSKRMATLERITARSIESTRLATWNVETGKILSQLNLHGEIRGGAWWADGSRLAVSLSDGLTVLQVDNGTALYRIPGVRGGEPVSISPDNQLVAAPRPSEAQQTTGKGPNFPVDVTIWETRTGKEIATVPTGMIFYYQQRLVTNVIMGARLALAADNRTLVTTDDAHLRVWDLTTGKERQRFALPIAMTDAWGQTAVTSLTLSPDGRRAFTSFIDGTALVWDLTPALHARPQPAVAVSEQDFNSWWEDLVSDDAKRAYAAIWRFTDAPANEAVAFLTRRLRPLPVPEQKQLKRLIQDLDSESFAAREAASKELAKLGEMAVPAMREALDQRPTLEHRRRLEMLLSLPYLRIESSEALRSLRAIAVLEGIATPEARQLLAKLAAGAVGAPDAREARAALARITARPAPK